MLWALVLACAAPEGASPGGSAACAPGGVLDDAGACVPERCGSSAPSGDRTLSAGESIQAAADELGGGTLVLSPGVWTETLEFGREHAGLRLLGRCPELVTLDVSGPADTGGLHVKGADAQVDLAGLTVRGGATGGAWVERGALGLTDVDLVGASSVGLVIVGASSSARLERVRIAEVSEGELAEGWGLYADGGAVVDAAQLVVDHARVNGIFVNGRDTRFTGQDIVVTRTQSSDQGTGETGLMVKDAGTFDAQRVRLEANEGTGMMVDGATVHVTDIDVVGSLPDTAGFGGDGTYAYGVDLHENQSTFLQENQSTRETRSWASTSRAAPFARTPRQAGERRALCTSELASAEGVARPCRTGRAS